MQKFDRSAHGKVLQLTRIIVEVIDIAIRAVVILILTGAENSLRIPAIESIRNRVSEQLASIARGYLLHLPEVSYDFSSENANGRFAGEFTTRESAIRD